MKLERTDDAILVKMIADARAEALEALYDRYNRFVFSVALAVLGDHAVAEEVTLDVFMRVWRSANTYRAERAKVSTWLAAIARHHAIDMLRWQRSRPDVKNLNLYDVAQQEDTSAPDPQENVEMTLQREEIRGAFERLPHEQQQVLVLAYFKGYTQSQIASLLAQPLGTIKTRIRLALQKVRQLLLKEEQPVDKSEDVQAAYPIDRKE